MERKKASDFPQALLDLFDAYVHGGISRRAFLDGAQRFAVGGVAAAALFDMLRPNYALAVQVPPTDARIAARRVSVPSPKGTGTINGYLVRPATADRLPGVIVIHENRGLTPYIEDVARRLVVANFIAFAPDGLTSVGGYPGDDEKGLALFKTVDPDKMQADFLAAAEWLKAQPDCTGKLGAVGFCFGGNVVNSLAVAMGAGLAAAVPFYGVEPSAADATKIKAPINAQYGELDTRITSGLAGVRRRADRGSHPARGPYLQGRQPRLPQRHDSALRPGGGEGGVGSDDRLAQQVLARQVPARLTAARCFFRRRCRNVRTQNVSASSAAREPCYWVARADLSAKVGDIGGARRAYTPSRSACRPTGRRAPF